jgi:CubicO group peptidase (beta-lactamase class C family)
MGATDDHIWEAGYEGHEAEQLQRMAKLSMQEKLQWLEESHDLVMHMEQQRKEQDPVTIATKQVLQSHIASGSTKGASILLMRKDRVELQICMGETDTGVPMREDSILLWLSSGKPVTAIAIATLYERGLLGLDDLVARYIPEFAANGKDCITIRHLLTHTAGLHRALPAVWEFSDWESILSHIYSAPLPPGWVPGEMAAYDAGAGWFVMGEIIQRITGQPFETYVQQNVFGVCGITDAGYSCTEDSLAQLGSRVVRYFNTASGQAHPVAWNSPTIACIPRPGASLRAPIRSMVRFYDGLRQGVILRPETLALFTAPSRGKLPDKTFGVPMDWGLGIMVNNGARMPYSFGERASARAFGHGGQQSSIVFCDPEKDVIFAAAYNGLCGELQHNLRMRELFEAVFGPS